MCRDVPKPNCVRAHRNSNINARGDQGAQGSDAILIERSARQPSPEPLGHRRRQRRPRSPQPPLLRNAKAPQASPIAVAVEVQEYCRGAPSIGAISAVIWSGIMPDFALLERSPFRLTIS